MIYIYIKNQHIIIYDMKTFEICGYEFFLCHYLEFQESQALVKKSEILIWKILLIRS